MAIASKHCAGIIPSEVECALRELDAYCDLHAMEESRPPLLITGPSGTGRTAALAYWVERRRRDPACRRLGEVVVAHFAGASWESTQVRKRRARSRSAPLPGTLTHVARNAAHAALRRPLSNERRPSKQLPAV